MTDRARTIGNLCRDSIRSSAQKMPSSSNEFESGVSDEEISQQLLESDIVNTPGTAGSGHEKIFERISRSRSSTPEATTPRSPKEPRSQHKKENQQDELDSSQDITAPQQPKEPDSLKENSFNLTFGVGLGFAVVIIGYCIMFFYFYESKHEPQLNLTVSENMLNRFNKEFEILTKLFPGQSDDTLNTIRGAIKSVMKEKDPKDPACIMLIGEKKNSGTTFRFAEKLAQTVKSALSYLPSRVEVETVRGSELAAMKSGDVTRRLENATKVAQPPYHILLLEELQNFPETSLPFLHTICDNNQAPFRRLIMLMTVNLDIQMKELDPEDVFNRWKEMGVSNDRIGALDSRIGNYKVIINAGEQSTQ